MQSYDIKLHGSALQIFDSAGFDVPDDYNVPFPSSKSYLCIPTVPDHIGGVKLDVYRDKQSDIAGQQRRYTGEIDCPSGTLVIETSLVCEIDNISFDDPGKKHIEVWSDKENSPEKVAFILSE